MYLLKELHQLKNHHFAQTMIKNIVYRLDSKSFKEYPDWLECDIQKDVAFFILLLV